MRERWDSLTSGNKTFHAKLSWVHSKLLKEIKFSKNKEPQKVGPFNSKFGSYIGQVDEKSRPHGLGRLISHW